MSAALRNVSLQGLVISVWTITWEPGIQALDLQQRTPAQFQEKFTSNRLASGARWGRCAVPASPPLHRTALEKGLLPDSTLLNATGNPQTSSYLSPDISDHSLL